MRAFARPQRSPRTPGLARARGSEAQQGPHPQPGRPRRGAGFEMAQVGCPEMFPSTLLFSSPKLYKAKAPETNQGSLRAVGECSRPRHEQTQSSRARDPSFLLPP